MRGQPHRGSWMSSTVETLEKELAAAQEERESEERAVIRAQNAHEAACSERDDAWSGLSSADPEVEHLTALVYERRRKLYEAIDRLKAAEGRERRVKSRLMYVLPAERRRYLSGMVDREFEELLLGIESVYRERAPGLSIGIVHARPGDLDLSGDPTWRALERLYGGSARRWVEVRLPAPAKDGAPRQPVETLALRISAHVSYYAGGHTPRTYVGQEEIPSRSMPAGQEFPPPSSHTSEAGIEALARVTVHRYLDEGSVLRLCKRGAVLVQVAELARLYQTMSLTVDEVRWRLEQLVSLRLEILRAVYDLTGTSRRFSFYEIARSARLLDAHFPDPEVASEALSRSVERALDSGVPLVDVAYMYITG